MSNPFDEDVGTSYGGGRNREERHDHESHDERIQRIMQEIDDSESRQLDSMQRALASIDDSERTGIATAEELLHQREQLNNIEKKTTHINQDLKVSQKHITGIKSIFGGIKNWWNGDKDPAPKSTEPQPSKLQETVEKTNSSRPHPGERLRTDNGRGFYDDDDGLDDQFMKGARKPQTQYIAKVTHSRKEEQLNENLDMMSQGLGRLKGLAQGLGDEIETQNEQLDRIAGGVDRADIKLKDQNRQMRGILKDTILGRLKGLAQGLGDEIETQNEQLDRIAGGVDRADIKLKDQNRQMRGILK